MADKPKQYVPPQQQTLVAQQRMAPGVAAAAAAAATRRPPPPPNSLQPANSHPPPSLMSAGGRPVPPQGGQPQPGSRPPPTRPQPPMLRAPNVPATTAPHAPGTGPSPPEETPISPPPPSSSPRVKPPPPVSHHPATSAQAPPPARSPIPQSPHGAAPPKDDHGHRKEEHPPPSKSPTAAPAPPSAPHAAAPPVPIAAAPTSPQMQIAAPGKTELAGSPAGGDRPQAVPGVKRGFEPDSFLVILQKQDRESADVLLGLLKESSELKRKIAMYGKKNFQLETDIGLLDKKISLLIKNRISLEEVLADKGAIMDVKEKTVSLNKHDAELYGRMFFLLQRQTKYISALASLVKIGEIDNFLQTVMFTLYGNQYEEEEEHLLLTMFRTVLKEDFAEAKSLNEVLRANTALTRMMNTYTRRGPGQNYLKMCLTKLIASLIEENENLEINPGKVYESYINEYESTQCKAFDGERKLTPEQCAELPQIRSIIDKRITSLDAVTARFVDAIASSMQHVPYGIRYICQQIKRLIKERWPDATGVQICCAIGGFMILRFINPAIITPNAYMLTDAKLSAGMRRNLTLLAKVLQNLSNNQPFGGMKEFYMAPLNPVLKKYQPRLDEFLDRLTEVDELDNHLEMDQFLAMGKFQTEQSITISLNEIHFIHSLLREHCATIFPPGMEGDELRGILSQMPDPPPALARKDNANVELKLVNLSSRMGDGDRLQPEQLYGETKYLVFSLMRAVPRKLDLTPGDVHTMLGQLASWAAMHSDQELLDRISKILANLKKLTQCGLLGDDDNYARLRRDLYDDVTNVQERMKKIRGDTERLRQVLQSMIDRNEFGLGQLRAYEEYLTNVRSKTIPSGDKGPKVKSVGPLKMTHQQLERDGVIMESQIPDDRKANIVFQISTLGSGAFEVSVSYRSRDIGSMRLQLDDLLERQANNELQLETDFVTLNVNLLIFLLNRHFVMQ